MLTANNKIQALESQIKDLEQNNPDSSELSRLKQELTTLKANSQTEINQLRNQLTQAKVKESQLSQKLKEFTRSKATKESKIEIEAGGSGWTRFKTPLYYLGGGLIILLILGWIRNQLKNQ